MGTALISVLFTVDLSWLSPLLLGSGVLAVLTTLSATVPARQVTLGNLLFKLLGVALAAPLAGLWLQHARPHVADATQLVVRFQLAFNVVLSLALIGLSTAVARLTT